MRVTSIAIALGAVAACKGGKKTAPASDAAMQIVVGPTVDAGRPWFALPIDASPDAKQPSVEELADLGGNYGPVEIDFIDAPVGRIMTMLTAEHVLVAGPASQSLVRGRATADNRAGLIDVVHNGLPDAFPAPVHKPKGKAEAVTLEFRDAKADDLFKLFSDVERRNYVLAPGTVMNVDIIAQMVPSDSAATAVAAAIGRTMDVSGNVIYLRDPNGFALDPALIKAAGPTVSIDTKGAHAGEVYALLGQLGVKVGGGAACDGGDVFDVKLNKVKAGTAIAVIAALSTLPPSQDSDCALLLTGDPLAAPTLRAIGSAGKHKLALIGDGTAAKLLDSKLATADAIGTDYIMTGYDTSTALHPYVAPADVGDYIMYGEVPAWAKDMPKARLAATLLDGEHRVALIEMPDGTWHTLASDDDRLQSAIRVDVGRGRIWYMQPATSPSGSPSYLEMALTEK